MEEKLKDFKTKLNKVLKKLKDNRSLFSGQIFLEFENKPIEFEIVARFEGYGQFEHKTDVYDVKCYTRFMEKRFLFGYVVETIDDIKVKDVMVLMKKAFEFILETKDKITTFCV